MKRMMLKKTGWRLTQNERMELRNQEALSKRSEEENDRYADWMEHIED